MQKNIICYKFAINILFLSIGDGDYLGRDQEVQHRAQIRIMAFTRKHDQRKPMWRVEPAPIASLPLSRVVLIPF